MFLTYILIKTNNTVTSPTSQLQENLAEVLFQAVLEIGSHEYRSN